MITDEMVEQATIKLWCAFDGDTVRTWHEADEMKRARFRARARAVLEYATALGPTREERLKDYRCAVQISWGGTGATPDRVENRAHAMLAAERPADAPARDERADDLADEIVALRSGLREALALLEGCARAETVDRLRALLPDEKGSDDGQS